MKLSGAVKYRDVETGVWVIEGDDGKTYELAGGDRKIKKDGSRVEVDGDLDKDSLTSAMVGPRFVVKSYRFI
jgi:cob(I)alamin adenosyltransferase